MKKLILPLGVAVVSLTFGATAGYFLQFENEEFIVENEASVSTDTAEASEFIKILPQFVIPVIKNNNITSLVVLSLEIEADESFAPIVVRNEPKLRDAILQALFEYANIGGFDGSFTDTNKILVLRSRLTEVAQAMLGPQVRRILVTDILRQDS